MPGVDPETGSSAWDGFGDERAVRVDWKDVDDGRVGKEMTGERDEEMLISGLGGRSACSLKGEKASDGLP